MACMKTEDTPLSKEVNEIVTFENLTASVCLLRPSTGSVWRQNHTTASPYQEQKIANRN